MKYILPYNGRSVTATLTVTYIPTYIPPSRWTSLAPTLFKLFLNFFKEGDILLIMIEGERFRDLIQDFVKRRNASLQGCHIEISGMGKKCNEGCAFRTESTYPNSVYPCKAVKELGNRTLLVPKPTIDDDGVAHCESYKPNLATSLRNLAVSVGRHFPILPL